MKQIKKTVLLNHAIEDVWTALTTAEALAEWLMPNTFSKAEPGATFRFQYDPDPICGNGIVQCRILKVDSPHSMTWEWQNGPVKKGGKTPPPMQVEWHLEPFEGGTKLTLTQHGLKGQAWFIPFAMSFGWSMYLKKLLPKVMGNIHQAHFTRGAIPLEKRLYKATNLPPEVVI